MINCSRDAVQPLKFWWLIHKVGTDEWSKQANGMMECTQYLDEQLTKIDWPHWVNEYSNTVFFKRPAEWIRNKYMLANGYLPEYGENLTHIVVMQHVTRKEPVGNIAWRPGFALGNQVPEQRTAFRRHIGAFNNLRGVFKRMLPAEVPHHEVVKQLEVLCVQLRNELREETAVALLAHFNGKGKLVRKIQQEGLDPFPVPGTFRQGLKVSQGFLAEG